MNLKAGEFGFVPKDSRAAVDCSNDTLTVDQVLNSWYKRGEGTRAL